jgi:hypothetical protein
MFDRVVAEDEGTPAVGLTLGEDRPELTPVSTASGSSPGSPPGTPPNPAGLDVIGVHTPE